MILGTAGHVDHGKTALVRALTGVDTDRLPEEKRRGITIDLGFAPLHLADDLVVGVVDVPGHEAFVRNMLAGATGIDLAMLVVAADEGVMPQTREHLAILTLLGIRDGIVALTKADLADADWLELVREDVRAALGGSPLALAPIISTSVVTMAGITELRAAVAEAARRLPARDDRDLFRMPVDRAFTVRGTGTVVTGTVWSGTLGRDSTAELLPRRRVVRVRRIESHGVAVDVIHPGMRAAVALAGVDVREVNRGAVLLGSGIWSETRSLLGSVALLPSVTRVVGPRTAVRFHLGTAETGARIVVAGGTIHPGEVREARIVLKEPVVARAGDRFVLRGGSPLETIGGGVVSDPQPLHRRPRLRGAARLSSRERLMAALADASHHGIAASALPVRIGDTPDDVAALLPSLSELITPIGDKLYDTAFVASLTTRLCAAVKTFHEMNPLEPGASIQSVRAQLGVEPALAEAVVLRGVAGGELEVFEALLRVAGWRPKLTVSQEKVRNELLATLESTGREPPDIGTLENQLGRDAAPIARFLERAGIVVRVEEDRYYSKTSVDEMVRVLRERMQRGREYAPPELREFLGLSRKFLIPFLEYCDRSGVTERKPQGRVLR